ncbi:sensor of ECF-type sigma factor [uncultured Lacinutrix sp.]|uniref:sensor of ECF-type sigma factor n=1 Tax=uncultured Lacinutrix sp. TaxID=574032 RepID=UPI002619720E|nr:sensor of ECF-type sigma factor [uncultured Lacinutrix sp.]
MKTLKLLFIPLFALLFSINSHAQKPDKEKIKALKIAHITEQLDLTTKEAQAFWPIYNANDEARHKLRDNYAKNKTEELCKPGSKITEAEAKDLLNKIYEIEESKYKIEKKYYNDLSAILSSKKILTLINAERTFRYKMIKEFKERHRKD